ncbi:MAG: cobalamin biosynthesis protein, partial [Bacteroidetes bacterium]|nr:cobalamin biosynthesis protein [Bacteroidota bacterium]
MQPLWSMILPLAGGYLADLLLGDPRGWPHPIRLFGWLIHKGEVWLNRGRLRLVKGMLLTLMLVAAVYGICSYIEGLLGRLWMPGYYLFSSVLVFFGLANRTLLQEG